MDSETKKGPENFSAKNALADWDKQLTSIARSIVRKQFADLDSDDVLQSLRLWFLTDKHVPHYLEEGESGKLMVSAQRQAGKFCRAERAAIEGYRPEDNYRYSLKTLRVLLPKVWDFRDWLPVPVMDGEIRAKGLVNEGGNLPAMLADVKHGLLELRDEDFQLLMQHFRFDKDVTELAVLYELDETVMRTRVQRALQRLRRALGSDDLPDMEHEGPGSRQVMSNAAAIAGTRSNE